MKRHSIIYRSICAINSVIKNFQENPYNFLYESDIQCALFCALRNEITGHIKVPNTKTVEHRLNLVYSEYLNKIDIVCLDPEAIVGLDPSLFRKDTFIYNLPVFLGIELKYIWMHSNNGFNVLQNDYEKLTKIKETIKNWMVLGFIQREKEIGPFIKDAKNYCQTIPLNSVEHLNDIYIITPKEIYACNYKSD